MFVRARVQKCARVLRRQRSLSLEDVSEATGLTLNAVEAIETGSSVNLPAQHIHALANVYDVDISDLLRGLKRCRLWPSSMPKAGTWIEHIRQQVRERRQALNVSTPLLAQWADDTGIAQIHQSWIIRLENGGVETCDLNRVERLAMALDSDLHTLVDHVW